MECVIKITKGPEEGQEFRLTGTEAVVGRSARSQVRLGGQSVSYEHAVISRNGDDFYIENLSANGTFVNDERITGKVRLRAKDQLQFGQETWARVEAVPTSGGLGNRKWLIYAVAALVILLVGVWVWGAVFPKETGEFNLKDAYPKLEAFVEEQVARKKMSAQDLEMLREAWRLEMAKDRTDSVPRWRDLNILLSSPAREGTMGFQEALRANPTALQRLAKSDPRMEPPTEDELKAGLVQFVSRLAQTR